ncbi:MAG: universal stress protein [Actinobacteria bacterium]|nr:universal stress protein [Actinomycetota bacterium]
MVHRTRAVPQLGPSRTRSPVTRSCFCILGSVASYVAAHSKVPVVIVPQHD